MPINFINSLSSPEGLNNLLVLTFKFFLVTASILYLIFAFVILRQIKIMKDTLITTFSPVIRLLGLVHLLMAIGLVVLFMVIL